MEPQHEPNPFRDALARTQRALADVDPERAGDSLPALRAAAESLTDAIDEAMATAVLHEGLTLRSAGDLAGLSENAVGPRLARTSLLAAYAAVTDASTSARSTPKLRVTARSVERARYDVEQGRHVVADDDEQSRPPMRFKPRRA